MKIVFRAFVLSYLVFSATQNISAMCLATPCYLLRVAVASTKFSDKAVSCLLDGMIVSSKEVECSGVNAFGGFNLSMLNSENKLPKLVGSPLLLNEDRNVCDSLEQKEELLLYAFQDCCDTPGRHCIRGYQARIVRPL
jgi:hypothetical protein